MNTPAIIAEGLGKEFRIGALNEAPYQTLRDTLADALLEPYRRVRRMVKGESFAATDAVERFWALKDVSFEIKSGEVVGLIGRNGAGKSTLLKILSRITEPTEGRALTRGRVGSLLEVGTGFHQELTGRENIYLNGAILGMKRQEVRRKFDEIVSFAEVEKFIDTPVKHYSSGMYLRLAFAVAAHLEPDILLVDEVLAVGDARFQRKCLNRMQDVGHEGRTVLFVSHNMPAVTRLCSRSILIDEGTIRMDGPSHQVVGAYLNSETGAGSSREWDCPESAPRGSMSRLVAIRVRDEQGRFVETVDIREPVVLEIEYDVLEGGHVCMATFSVFTEEGIAAFSLHDSDPEWRGRRRPVGRYVSTAKVPGNFLSEGTMFVSAGLTTLEPQIFQFYERDAVNFHVNDCVDYNSARGGWVGSMGGVVRPMLEWKTRFTPEEFLRPEMLLQRDRT